MGGLAGLRVGYGIFPRALMPHLWKIKQPYNVNVAADVAARASLQDVDFLLERVRQPWWGSGSGWKQPSLNCLSCRPIPASRQLRLEPRHGA